MDSLRYWILEMHVDGFRFDLAATLARELHEVDRLSSFFDIIHQDPVISQVKLIAEPWDIGEGGYQVGKFPPGWAEWNGKYRDCIRDYWRGATVCWLNLLNALPEAPICIRTITAALRQASISLLLMMALHCTIWFRITKNITKPMAKIIMTEKAITGHGTAE